MRARWGPLVALAALLHPAPAAAVTPPELVLTGTGSSYTDITFDRPLVFERRVTRLTGSGCGRYAGFFLRPHSTLPGPAGWGMGAVDFRLFPNPDERFPLRLGGLAFTGPRTAQLPAGRYRAVLLGEGRCTVRVATVAGAARIATRTPVDVRYDTRTLPPAGGAQVGHTVMTDRLGPSAYLLSAAHILARPTIPTVGPTATTCLDTTPALTCTTARDPQAGHANADMRHTTGPAGDHESITTYEGLFAGHRTGVQHAKSTLAGGPGTLFAGAVLFAFVCP